MRILRQLEKPEDAGTSGANLYKALLAYRSGTICVDLGLGKGTLASCHFA